MRSIFFITRIQDVKIHNNIERNKTTINCAISVFLFRIIIGSPIVGKGLKGLDGHFHPKLKRLGQARDLLHVWAESPRWSVTPHVYYLGCSLPALE